jgi:predicted enzyme related to lactoylglutathione lyase
MRGRRTMVPARELRFCFVIDDYEAAAHLYRDVFGLEVLMDLDEQGGRGVILNVPEATLELVDAEHGGMVDEVEVGRRVDDGVRIAVRVDDLQAASRAVTGAGGEAMAPPADTPWGDTNQRFRAKDGMQLTLFQSS